MQQAAKDKESELQKLELKLRQEMSELRNELDREKLVASKEAEKLKADFELNLKEMKMIYEQEKFNL